LLFVDSQVVGVLEAKKVEFPLGGVEIQAQQYSEGLPDHLDAPYEPLPLCYLSTGAVTKFSCNFDPHPRSHDFWVPIVRIIARELPSSGFDARGGARTFTFASSILASSTSEAAA
jgi:hypothetical protein